MCHLPHEAFCITFKMMRVHPKEIDEPAINFLVTANAIGRECVYFYPNEQAVAQNPNCRFGIRGGDDLYFANSSIQSHSL